MKVLSFVFSSIILFVIVKGKNYYIPHLIKLNWHGAFIDCLSRNQQLATINSAFEQSDVEAVIKAAGMENDPLWTSGTDQAEEGTYTWMSTGLRIKFTKWAPKQPDNFNDEDCMAITQFNRILLWNDWPCNKVFYYICEDKPN